MNKMTPRYLNERILMIYWFLYTYFYEVSKIHRTMYLAPLWTDVKGTNPRHHFMMTVIKPRTLNFTCCYCTNTNAFGTFANTMFTPSTLDPRGVPFQNSSWQTIVVNRVNPSPPIDRGVIRVDNIHH